MTEVLRGDEPRAERGSGHALWDVGDRYVLPGLVDSHVHVNEPGRTAWEGFETASAAAAAGGVTTLVDMPLNSDPVTTTVDALEAKARAASRACRIDYGLWAGLVAGSIGEIESLWRRGALGFKAFLVDSGLEDFPAVGRSELRAAMPRLAELGAPLLVHAEAPGTIDRATRAVLRRLDRDPGAAHRHEVWEASRPPEAEAEAIEMVAELAVATGCRVHIVHVSSAEGLARVEAAKAAGAPITAETCPHYLTFASAEVPDGAMAFKCAPPLRSAEDRDALWRGLERGVLDLIASDHSPCPPDAKRSGPQGFFGAWGGVSSLGLSLPAVWTGARRRGIPLEALARWLSTEPARLAGLEAKKGSIGVGRDADLAIFDPDDEYAVSPDLLLCRHPITPYAGMRMRGRVTHTLSRGRLVWAAPDEPYPASALSTDPQTGRWLR